MTNARFYHLLVSFLFIFYFYFNFWPIQVACEKSTTIVYNAHTTLLHDICEIKSFSLATKFLVLFHWDVYISVGPHSKKKSSLSLSLQSKSSVKNRLIYRAHTLFSLSLSPPKILSYTYIYPALFLVFQFSFIYACTSLQRAASLIRVAPKTRAHSTIQKRDFWWERETVSDAT